MSKMAPKLASTFALDVWYFAALSSDIKTGALIRVEIAGEPITLGRKKDGCVFALRDICPHRAAPLSAGRIVDDSVECPFMVGDLEPPMEPAKTFRPFAKIKPSIQVRSKYAIFQCKRTDIWCGCI